MDDQSKFFIESRNYVEELWIDYFTVSITKEINSIDEYLNNTEFDPTMIGLRFYKKDFLSYDGKEFCSEPYNYSEWISHNHNDSVTLENNEKVNLGEAIDVYDYLAYLEENKTKQKKK